MSQSVVIRPRASGFGTLLVLLGAVLLGVDTAPFDHSEPIGFLLIGIGCWHIGSWLVRRIIVTPTALLVVDGWSATRRVELPLAGRPRLLHLAGFIFITTGDGQRVVLKQVGYDVARIEAAIGNVDPNGVQGACPGCLVRSMQRLYWTRWIDPREPSRNCERYLPITAGVHHLHCGLFPRLCSVWRGGEDGCLTRS